MFKRMFEGNTDFGKLEASWKEDFIKRVAEAGGTKEEMINVLKDLNVIVSKAMNDTIDAAKNPGDVDMPYMDNFQANYRSGAVATKDYAAIKLLPGKLALAPLQLSIRGAKDAVPAGKDGNPFKRVARKEKRGKGFVWVVEDLLTAVRNETAVYAYQKLQEKLRTSMDEEIKSYQTKDLRLYSSLKFLAESYDSVMHIDDGDKNAMKKAIVQMSRNLIRNNSPVASENLFQEAYRASCYTDKKTGAVRTNSYYMAFTHEATEYFVEHHNPDGEFENRIYKFGGGKAKVGQRITFIKGISEDGFYAETPISGTYTLEINNELQAVVRKPVRDMIPDAEYDDSVVFLRLIPKAKSSAQIVELVEKARAARAPFSLKYYQPEGSLHDNLWLFAGRTPISEICNPLNQNGKSRYEQLLAGKKISIDQIEILRSNKPGTYDKLFAVGHMI